MMPHAQGMVYSSFTYKLIMGHLQANRAENDSLNMSG